MVSAHDSSVRKSFQKMYFFSLSNQKEAFSREITVSLLLSALLAMGSSSILRVPDRSVAVSFSFGDMKGSLDILDLHGTNRSKENEVLET